MGRFSNRPLISWNVDSIIWLTQHDKPLRLLDAILVRLGVTKGRDVDLVGLLDLAFGPVADEDGLATPLDNDVLALGDGSQVDLDLSHSQDIG